MLIELNYQYMEIANEFISTLGAGKMPGVIYDTAVVASLTDNAGISLFPNQAKTVLDSQFEDGSWGAKFYNPYDRLLSTVSVLNMILELDLHKDPVINQKYQNAINWLEIAYDPSMNYNVAMNVGFEFLFPYFSAQVMDKSSDLVINLSSIEKSRARKLEIMGDAIFKVPTPLLFSIEGVIESRDQALSIGRFQSPNGSIATSPAATSVLIKHRVHEHIPDAMKFLNKSILSDGLMIHFHDYQYMNISFSLYPLIKAGFQFGVQGLHTRKLLNEGWKDEGVAFGKSFLSADADDTAMVLLDLNFLGDNIQSKIDILLQYEKDEYFQTYFGEVDPSFMTNLHILELFLSTSHDRSDSVVEKLLGFIKKNQDDLLNISKYNSSNYIQHASLVLSLLPKLPEITEPILRRLENLAEEALGQVDQFTTEECAHTLLALLYAKGHGQAVNQPLVDSLYSLLQIRVTNHHQFEENFLWTAKVLYSPTQISQGHILAAYMLYDRLCS